MACIGFAPACSASAIRCPASGNCITSCTNAAGSRGADRAISPMSETAFWKKSKGDRSGAGVAGCPVRTVWIAPNDWVAVNGGCPCAILPAS